MISRFARLLLKTFNFIMLSFQQLNNYIIWLGNAPLRFEDQMKNSIKMCLTAATAGFLAQKKLSLIQKDSVLAT